MAAEQQPNFILRGVRNLAEKSFKPAIGLAVLGLFVTSLGILAAPALSIAFGDAVALGMIKKSRAVA